jgi:hypothetical protein
MDSTAHDRKDRESVPSPTVPDVLEGIAAVLDDAVELAEPRRTTARCLTIAARVQAAANGHVDADELLTSLRRLQSDWRAS